MANQTPSDRTPSSEEVARGLPRLPARFDEEDEGQESGQRTTIIERHTYRDQIEMLLLAGWSAVNVNAVLQRLFSDYQAVKISTLKWYRAHRLQGKPRPLQDFETKVAEEHALIDPVTKLAAIVEFCSSRVQKAAQVEEEMSKTMQGTGLPLMLPIVRAEVETLLRAMEAYQHALERLGYLPKMPVAPLVVATAGGQVQVNVLQLLEEEAGKMPLEIREQLGRVLELVRKVRLDERLGAIKAERAAMLPDSEEGL